MTSRRARLSAIAGAAAALLLGSCGGGGGGDTALPAVELRNGPAEFLRCDVPEQVSVVRENEDASGWKTHRYLRFPGKPLTRVLPLAPLATAKNPEGAISHGPLHAQNCTPGAGAVQTLSFRLRSQGFHGSGIGDHLAFALRMNYPTFNAVGNEKYDGIGIIFHQSFGGVLGERFRYPEGNDMQSVTQPQIELADDTTYLVEMQADITAVSYRVTAEASGQSTGWKSYVQPAGFAPLQGTGLAIGFLCRDDNGRCEAPDSAFRVDIFDIAAGWR